MNTIVSVLLLIIVCVLFIAFCTYLAVSIYNSMYPTRWEYLIVGIEDYSFERDMNKLGKEGWELVFARRALAGESYYSRALYECILKKQIKRDMFWWKK